MEYLKEIVDFGIIGILIFMSILSLTVLIERILYYKKVNLKEFKSKEVLENALTNNLTVVATVASNAPYIGLLGTVLAIMQTFIEISKGGFATAKIMASLALALKTTAVGLLVAILAVIFYNYLARKVESILAKYQGGEF
jgi:biopolymer transport protein ExbB